MKENKELTALMDLIISHMMVTRGNMDGNGVSFDDRIGCQTVGSILDYLLDEFDRDQGLEETIC